MRVSHAGPERPCCIRGYAKPHRTEDLQPMGHVHLHGFDSPMAGVLVDWNARFLKHQNCETYSLAPVIHSEPYQGVSTRTLVYRMAEAPGPRVKVEEVLNVKVGTPERIPPSDVLLRTQNCFEHSSNRLCYLQCSGDSIGNRPIRALLGCAPCPRACTGPSCRRRHAPSFAGDRSRSCRPVS